jgi:hypothetical protein
MALAFFRRRQKMVVIIMAVLMVSFLVGYQGLSMIFRQDRGPGSQMVGRAVGGKVMVEDLKRARNEIQWLYALVGLGNPYREPQGQLTQEMIDMDVEFSFLRRNSEGPERLAYVLLLQEAEEAGVTVSELDIDAFLEQIGLSGEDYTNRIAEVRDSPGMTERHFRGLIAKWLLIHKTFVQASLNTPPSVTELRRLYRDSSEQIALRFVRLSAEDYLDDVPQEFSPAEIQQQFGSYANALPERYASSDSFGFGYQEPNRVAIAYLLVDREKLRRGIRPEDKSVRSYYRTHPEEFLRQAEQVGGPEQDSESQPASDSLEAPSEPKTFAEARAEIVQMLSDQLTDVRLEEVAGRALSAQARIASESASKVEPLDAVLDELIEEEAAEAALSRQIRDLWIDAEPLSQAMEKLAQSAGLTAISYPWGRHGMWEVSSEVKVTLNAEEPMTLGDALKEITRQVFAPASEGISGEVPGRSPQLQWVCCAGLDGALFVHGPVADTFPVSVQRTDLLDRRQLEEHPVLAVSSTSSRGGQRLSDLAFQAKEFQRAESAASGIEAGSNGPPMYVAGDTQGRLLWWLSQAVPAQKPTSITPAIRERIVADLRSRAAFAKVEQLAARLSKVAQESGLAAAAAEAGKETEETELFTRMVRVSPRGQMIQYAHMLGRLDMRTYLDAQTLQPHVYTWSRIVGIDLPTTNHGRYFMEKAFSLVPPDPDNPDAPADPSVQVFLNPSRREALLLERSDYRPAVIGDFEEEGASAIARSLVENRQWASMVQWFGLRSIQDRAGFMSETAPADEEADDGDDGS